MLFFDEDACSLLLIYVYGLELCMYRVILDDLPLPIMATPMGLLMVVAVLELRWLQACIGVCLSLYGNVMTLAAFYFILFLEYKVY